MDKIKSFCKFCKEEIYTSGSLIGWYHSKDRKSFCEYPIKKGRYAHPINETETVNQILESYDQM